MNKAVGYHKANRLWGKDGLLVKRAVPIMLALIVAINPLAGFAKEYRTIIELGEDTPQRWHQTYEVGNYTICVDVDVNIPDGATIPAIRMAFVKRKVLI